MLSIPIINLAYEIFKEVFSINSNLPKRYRYSLGISIETNVNLLLENLISAKNAPKPNKSSYLIKADTSLEMLSMQLRLLMDLRLINETRLFQLQSSLSEAGRMLGGWIKSV